MKLIGLTKILIKQNIKIKYHIELINPEIKVTPKKIYYESLAEGDDVQNFFGWLFDDARFNNTTVWTLPENYEDAYQQFLNLFPSI